MKNLFLTIITSLLLFIPLACTQSDDVLCDQSQKTDVTFNCINIDITPLSRATLADAGMTDLWVFEGTQLLKHQQSTDTDFGTPTITLTYGQHTLTFITSKAQGQTLTNGIWTCSKLNDTFATTSTINLTATSPNTHNINLYRRISKVQFTTTDKIPSDVASVYIKLSTCKSLNAALEGTDAYNYEATVNVSSKQGSTYTNFINTLTTSPTEEEDCAFLIRWLSSTNAVLYEYERTLKVKPNRCTNLKGNFFSGDNFTISLTTDWDTQLDVPLFAE